MFLGMNHFKFCGSVDVFLGGVGGGGGGDWSEIEIF